MSTHISNIQDQFFNENRDRDYASSTIPIKAQYDVIETSTEFSRFGLEIPTQYIFQVSFAKMIEKIGRPVVIGDIFELPSEMQYDANLRGVRKYLEVTDTSWSSQGFTPNWRSTLYRIVAEPLVASRETEDVIGYHKSYLNASDEDILNGDIPISVGNEKSSEFISQEAKTAVPETGTDVSDLATFDEDNNPNIPNTYAPTSAYVQDGLPPNNEPYTEGSTFPGTPTDGDYHRLTYPSSTKIPPKLFKWNAIKNRWIFQETDLRNAQSAHKKSIRDILSSSDKFDIG